MKESDKKIVHEIMELALNCEIAQVFVNWSPHIHSLAVSVHYPKWVEGSNPDFDSHCYFEEEFDGYKAETMQKSLMEFLAHPVSKPQPKPELEQATP